MNVNGNSGLAGLEIATTIGFYFLKGSVLLYAVLSIKEGLPRLREVHEGTHIRWKRRFPYIFMGLLSLLLATVQPAVIAGNDVYLYIAIPGVLLGYNIWLRHVVIRNPFVSLGHWLTATSYLLLLREGALHGIVPKEFTLFTDILVIAGILLTGSIGFARARRLVRQYAQEGTTAESERSANRVFVTEELIIKRFAAFRVFHWMAFIMLPFGIVASLLMLLGYVENDALDGCIFIASLSFMLLFISIVLGLGLVKNTWEAIQDGHARSRPEKIIAQMVNPLNIVVPYYTAAKTKSCFTGLAEDVNRYVREKELVVPGRQLTDEEMAAKYAGIVTWMRFPLLLPFFIMPAMLVKYRFHCNLRDALLTIISRKQHTAVQAEFGDARTVASSR